MSSKTTTSNGRNLHIITPPICVDCQRLHRRPPAGRQGLFCDAFPDGIPEAIVTTRVDHRKPFTGDHDLQFLAKSDAAAQDAAHLIAQAHIPDRPYVSGDSADLSNDWLYAWGDLPTTLDGLRKYLKDHDIDPEDFKNSARYEANEDRFDWLKDL